MRIAILPLLVIIPYTGVAQSLDGAYVGTDLYSSPETRKVWVEQLTSEHVGSPNTLRVAFHKLGHLGAVSGHFPLAARSEAAVGEWLHAHAALLGFPEGSTLSLSSVRPNLRFDGETERTQDGEVWDFQVSLDDVPFLGQPVVVILPESETPHIQGIYNAYFPLLNGITDGIRLTAEEAWEVARPVLNPDFESLSAVEGWYDPHWASHRIPSGSSHHWILTARDPIVGIRHLHISSETSTVISDSAVDFHFAVNETHYGRTAGGTIYYRSYDSSAMCENQSPSTCESEIYNESLLSRDLSPKLVDTFYKLSDPNSTSLPGRLWPPFPSGPPYPLYAANPIRVHTSSLHDLKIVLGSPKGGFDDPCAVNGAYFGPCYSSATQAYYFAKGDFNRKTLGHEYGHDAIRQLKLTEHRGISQARFFTEVMADFFAFMVDEYSLYNDRFGLPYLMYTDFEILPTYSFGVQWPSWSPTNPLNCRGDPRRFVGKAFYNAWLNTHALGAYSGGNCCRTMYFMLWATEIVKSYSSLGDSPEAADFYFSVIANCNIKPSDDPNSKTCKDPITNALRTGLDSVYADNMCEP